MTGRSARRGPDDTGISTRVNGPARPGAVKGWCPGAWRPMMSGDGLVGRVRPRLARIDAAQAAGLADLSEAFGSGIVELTRRGNLQLRGVGEDGHGALLGGLAELGLLDPDPDWEARRNILSAPDWVAGDATERLSQDLAGRLGELPDLPAKFGMVVDAGPKRRLDGAPGDIRIERAASGVIVRADGCDTGVPVENDTAIGTVVALARWFAAHRGEARRMAQLLATTPLSDRFTGVPPAPNGMPEGTLGGVAFGQMEAGLLRTLARGALRITPWRMVLLEGGGALPEGLLPPDDPLLAIDACPGAPFCTQATVETRWLARTLAGRAPSVHVSGCAKGCARSDPADVTLTGRDGAFDLVIRGRAGDTPLRRGLAPKEVPDAL